MKEIRSEKEMAHFARELAEQLVEKGGAGKAVVVGLSGELGSGKTAFMKALAGELGVTDTVVSPTFILERIYDIPKESIFGGVFDHLIHIDAYRLEGGGELKQLGWEKIVNNPHNVIFIEWPERVEDLLPEDTMYMRFEHVDEETRKVLLNSPNF